MTGQGVVLNEPSVVAIERSTHRVLAVGHEAKQMINHTPDAFSAEHPLRDVIADYDVTEAMLSAFINKAIERRYPWQAKPRIVICIPCGATSVEKRAVFEAAIQSGARQAYLIEEPMAAAMGADLPVTEPTGSMVVDIGGGTTEVAVISLGGIVTSSSLRLAGNKMDEAIAMHLRDLLGIKVGERTAEIIKNKMVPSCRSKTATDMIISGQDVVTEQPREVTIQSEDVRAALQPPIEEMVVHIKETFKNRSRPRQRHHFQWHLADGRRRPAFRPGPLHATPRDSRLDERDGSDQRGHGLFEGSGNAVCPQADAHALQIRGPYRYFAPDIASGALVSWRCLHRMAFKQPTVLEVDGAWRRGVACHASRGGRRVRVCL